MLHEEEPSGKVRGSQWPPEGSNIAHKPTSFFTKVSRGPGGRPVEWPPRPSQEENKQANMDQSQHQQQQQMMSQQQQVQQQQHRQQVTSSSEMRTVKQTYHVQQQQHQTYEQQGHQVGGFQQQALQYQQPQQQNVQYQMSQQTSSTAFQQLPASREQMMPSVFQNGAPAHPQAHTAPAPAPGHVSAPAPAPGPAPGPFPNPNAAPQHYANQNGTMPQHAPAPEGEDPLPAQILPQYQAPPGYSTAYTAVHGE